VVSLRKKIRAVLGLFGEDDIIGTRTASCLSQVARNYLLGRADAGVSLILLDSTTPRRLQIVIAGLPERVPSGLLEPFFDRFEWARDDGALTLTATLDLRAVRDVPSQLIREARAVVEEKERDELVAEITERNRELQDSLENLRRTRSAKDRMQSELNVGHEIQMNMLPTAFPVRPEFSMYARLKPAREIGGDFYDFYFLDPDHLCVAVGDVSGKGVPSALFAAVTKTLLSSFSKQDPSPASVITQASDELSTNNESCMFVTLMLGVLNTNTGELVYTNAGHNPPYIRRADGTVETLDGRHGPIAGAMEGFTYSEGRAELRQGDLLFVFTDGVVEATNVDDQLFSDERLRDILARSGNDNPEKVVDEVESEVHDFEGAAPQFDDVTMLALRYSGPEAGTSDRQQVSMRNTLDEIPTVIGALESFGEKNEIAVGIISRVSIALDELLNNIVSYGFESSGEHEIEVQLDVRANWLRVRLEDEGVPFNPFGLAPPDTSASIEEREIGGLGIHFVRNMMDEVRYQRLAERNVVEIGIRLEKAEEST
jgi:sigma-B regulation protein RsbU (phosphoserine phosphatase)